VGTTGLRIVQTDIYTAGEESYRTDLTIENTTGSSVEVILYRSLDCMVGGGDAGYGWQTPAGGVACTENSDNTPAGITEKFEDISGGANYMVHGYSTVFNAVKSRTPLPDTVKTDNGSGGVYDNGMAISWSFTVPASGSVTRSHLTAFDNTGYGSSPVPGETIDVGNASVGSSVTTTLTISETGSLPLTLSSYSIRGDHPDEFSITAPNFPFTIDDDGANRDVTIQCSPTVISPTRSASLIIRHNAPSGETTYPLICNTSGGGPSTIYLPLILKQPCACVCPDSTILSAACCN
jgi:hypothetical protein